MGTRLTDFRDRVALVTGASSGIGAQLARDLAARGVRVALVARRAERLEQLAAELGADRARWPSPATSRPVPPSRRRSRGCSTHWGRLDLLVNNAGLARHGLFKDEDPDTFARLMEINYLGTVWAIRAVLPAMRARGEGWIVNVSSVAGKLGQPDESAYSASKFAVTGLSEALVSELAPLGIHVMTVYPGAGAHRDVHARGAGPHARAREAHVHRAGAAHAPRCCAGSSAGPHEVTVPRYVGIAYLMRLLSPATSGA